MPNRYVRASAIESEGVNALGWQAEVFWRRLLNRADDFGRFTAHPDLVRAHIFPLQMDKVSVSDIARLLSECETVGLLYRYQSGGKPYLVMNKWEKGRAKHSEYPEPPPEVTERMRDHVYTCKHMQTDVPDTDSDPDSDSDAGSALGAQSAAKLTDAEWLSSLCQSPAYTGIDVLREHAKMMTWCQTNGKKGSRRRFVNWLNRAEVPMNGTQKKKKVDL
jgi:hypothetical protein